MRDQTDHAVELVESIRDQRRLYGDEPPDLALPDDLDRSWQLWEHSQELVRAARFLGTELVTHMASMVPEDTEVKLGDDLWRYKREGRWQLIDPRDTIKWLMASTDDPDTLARWLASLFTEFRITALDGIAIEIGLEPRVARNTFARWVPYGDVAVFSRLPAGRLPKYAKSMEHLERKERNGRKATA